MRSDRGLVACEARPQRWVEMTLQGTIVSLCNVSVEASTRGQYKLQAVDLEIRAGEAVAIVGPSGAGKTTLLWAIAGLTDAQGVSRAGDLERPGAIGMMFQEDVLFSWMSVAKNLDKFLGLQGADRESRLGLIKRALGAVGLADPAFLSRTPAQLSVGQRRRVSLAAALAGSARFWLLDEPTATFDFGLKLEIQLLLLALWRDLAATFIVVTHDIEEAVFLAQRVICIRDGRIIDEIQVDLGERVDTVRTSTGLMDYVAQVRDVFRSRDGGWS
jgi:ABC-type nitrate/sulfonate/bicarbonate transport system ATPase subunit